VGLLESASLRGRDVGKGKVAYIWISSDLIKAGPIMGGGGGGVVVMLISLSILKLLGCCIES